MVEITTVVVPKATGYAVDQLPRLRAENRVPPRAHSALIV